MVSTTIAEFEELIKTNAGNGDMSLNDWQDELAALLVLTKKCVAENEMLKSSIIQRLGLWSEVKP